jgi:hypothetical protein
MHVASRARLRRIATRTKWSTRIASYEHSSPRWAERNSRSTPARPAACLACRYRWSDRRASSSGADRRDSRTDLICSVFQRIVTMKLKVLNRYRDRSTLDGETCVCVCHAETRNQSSTRSRGLLGHRGGGKTLAIMNKIRHLREQGLCDRLIILGPDVPFEQSSLRPGASQGGRCVHRARHETASTRSLQIVEAEGEEWNRHLEELKRWKKHVEATRGAQARYL